ncbi:DUF3139 domain-containing protein [Gracilibacillus salinarum]|uniref:DUF3139 domain-containing protein n=1 Tax=Gracilibacillus salinarum TaxID=2932255 RepID=A0ABY4GRP1_9BACI|nr:DUF3139 domain-containing protein [Gracilibacillus salinarum]UOQ86901.1 DUF3139 domain-containing protein [Gracilibacillus salinarum]
MNVRKVKKRYFVFSILLFLILIWFSYDIYIKHSMESDVIDYLESNGYQDEEIEKISVSRSKPGITASVIFEDEKDKIYLYNYEDGEIVQSGYGVLNND